MEDREQGRGKKEKLPDFCFFVAFFIAVESQRVSKLQTRTLGRLKNTWPAAAGSHQPQKLTGKQGIREPACPGTSAPTIL